MLTVPGKYRTYCVSVETHKSASSAPSSHSYCPSGITSLVNHGDLPLCKISVKEVKTGVGVGIYEVVEPVHKHCNAINKRTHSEILFEIV